MREQKRRLVVLLIVAVLSGLATGYNSYRNKHDNFSTVQSAVTANNTSSPAAQALSTLAVKGRAPKTDYTRKQFTDGWGKAPGCDVRNYILKRDMTAVITKTETDCTVLQGNLLDPYTNKTIMFVRGGDSSDDVQIDHVVALSNAWQTGAQQLSVQQRYMVANDPLNLLAVDGPTNQKKSDADAATWLPPNKEYRCRYVARQIAVKQKYTLWVTQPEHDAMQKVLNDCPQQLLPVVTAI